MVASAGGLVGLAMVGAAWWRVSGARWRGRAVPLAAGLVPLPAALTALLHVEWPILLIGPAWVAAAVAFWRGVPADRHSPEEASV
jgi:hypothetical protein